MRIIGAIPVYNEVDIIQSTIEYLLSQGIELVILDGGSTDGSYQRCLEYLGRGVLSVERIETPRFEYRRTLDYLYGMALKRNPDWVLLNDADQFHESPYPTLTLKQAIETADQHGYNLIQFNNFEFWPTELDRESAEVDVRKRLRYYTWNDDCEYHCWKIYEGITVGEGGGHYPTFPETVQVRVAPTKYVLRHYRVRSYQQGLKKIFVDRLPRYSDIERTWGWHLHYDKFGRDESFFIIDSRNLNRYEEDDHWVVKKTFDWTWGVQGKPWANPPIPPGIQIRIATKFPRAAKIWKAIFLRKHVLANSKSRDKSSE